MKKIILSSLLIFFVAVPALAQNGRGVMNTSAVEMREGITEGVRQFNAEEMSQLQAKREELRNMIEAERETFRNTIQTTRENILGTIEQRREELRAELEKIQDQKKKEVAERVNNRFGEVNKRVLGNYNRALEQMEKVMLGISTRADKAELGGVDVSAIRDLLKNAEGKISEVRAKIAAQFEKTYTVSVRGDETLREDLGKYREMLHGDLSVVKDVLKEARDVVHNAAVALAQIPNVDEYKTVEE